MDALNWLAAQCGGSVVMAALASVGLLALLRYPVSFIRLLLSFTSLSKPFRISLEALSRNRVNGPPAWAIVTGSTGGIGKEFSLQLARSGLSVLLVGRSQTKLEELVREIEALDPAPKGLIKTHAIDLAAPSESDWEKFSLALSNLALQAPIAMLINNAGVSHASPVPFESTPLSELNAITAVNMVAPLRLTQIALPHMLKNRNGLILNVGSFSALVPTPLLATYAGSKSFLYTWSQALGTELEPKGIHVRLLNTYFVASEMSKIKKSSFMVPTPKSFVRNVLSNLGLSNGAMGHKYISTNQPSHALVQWLVDRFGSESFWLNYNLGLQTSIMKRVHRKKMRESEEAQRTQKEIASKS